MPVSSVGFSIRNRTNSLGNFAAGEKAYQGERFLANAEKDFALVGFGYETILKAQKQKRTN